MKMKMLKIVDPELPDTMEPIPRNTLINPITGSIRRVYGENQTVPMLETIANGPFKSVGFELSNEYIWHLGIDPVSGKTILVPEVRL
jgi:hypothetical protein